VGRSIPTEGRKEVGKEAIIGVATKKSQRSEGGGSPIVSGKEKTRVVGRIWLKAVDVRSS